MLKKWWQVYSNDDEKNFFSGKDGKSGLARSQDYDWRTTDALAREAGLTKAKTEQIIDKYHKAGLVIQHQKDPEKWGYWERVAPQLASQTNKSVSDTDKDQRIDKAKKKP
jgi:hypothetical protein